MATRNHSNLQPSSYGDEVRLVQWTGLLNGDDGDWIALPTHRDITVHCFGTFGVGAVLSIQGSNEVVASPTAPVTVNGSDSVGSAPFPMTFTTALAASVRQILDATHRLRPIVTAGDGTTNLTIIICARRSRG